MSFMKWIKAWIGKRGAIQTPHQIGPVSGVKPTIRFRKWKPITSSWMRQYEHLQAYRRFHPHTWPKERECFPEGNRLGLWCYHQRAMKKNGKLDNDKARLLDDIRFAWDGKHYWYRQYNNLLSFRRMNPNRWPSYNDEWPAGNKLGGWCHSQRTMFKSKQLAPRRIDLLNLIGFEWASRDHKDLPRNRYCQLAG